MTHCTGQRDGNLTHMTLEFHIDLEPHEVKAWAWQFPNLHWNQHTGTLTVQFCRNNAELDALGKDTASKAGA